MQKKKQPQTLFVDLKNENEPTVIESVCMNCYETGETKILLTKIPFFREIIVTSFYCDKCGYKNTEVQFAGQLPDYGVEILFKALSRQDLNREIIISQNAKIWIEELNLEMPKIKKAEITTLEGLLVGVEEDLLENQEERKQKDPEQFRKLEQFVSKLKDMSSGNKFPITIRIKDPSGNSNIKNPFAPKVDKNLHISNIQRTLEDLTNMGYSIQNAKQQLRQLEQKKVGNKMNFTKPFQESEFMKYEPVLFDVPCHSCQMPGQMKMCQTSVPYFTDMIIMSFVCDHCGAHSTETKITGDVKEEGCIITLKCDTEADLKRDLFKSETCSVQIPEIQLELDYGTLGGVFTTVQGLLEKISDHLDEQNPFTDSDTNFYTRMQKLLKDLQQLRNGTKSFTLIMKDPLGHSFLQNPDYPNEDKKAKRVQYKRTKQQNDVFGLSDMKVQNYETSDTRSTGSMKKSKDRRYSQGSVESLQQLKKRQQGAQLASPTKKSEQKIETTQQQHPPIKFTKESPHKVLENNEVPRPKSVSSSSNS